MAVQRLSDRKLRRINALSGRDYISVWYRGGGNWRWVQGELPPTGRAANRDYVNRETGEWVPLIRDGQPVAPKDYRTLEERAQDEAFDRLMQETEAHLRARQSE